VILVSILPLVWGVSFFTFWYRNESFYRHAQALAFPVSVGLGVMITYFITTLFGMGVQSYKIFGIFIIISMFIEYYVEKQIVTYREGQQCTTASLLIGPISTVTLWGVIFFLTTMLIYGRMRLFGVIDGDSEIDAISLFIINDLHMWFIEDV
jgi:hypothetical protein